MRYEITHHTTYAYDSEVSASHHVAHLTPRNLLRQRRVTHELQVTPAPAFNSPREDYFGNPVTFLAVESAHRELVMTARSVVEVLFAQYPASDTTPAWETIRDRCLGDGREPAQTPDEFVFQSPHVPRHEEYAQYARACFPAGRPVLSGVLELTNQIYHDFTFDPKATTIATPLTQVLREKRGVWQDFAHFQIACLRSLGLPARYVSGYLETLPPPGVVKLVGSDASHAWVQVWCGAADWIDVDPTNNLIPSDRHITLAWGRDFSDVSPIRGVVVGGGKHTLKVAVDVTPLAGAAGAPVS